MGYSVKSCDLMLYWNEKQFLIGKGSKCAVVIWCSIEMRNSTEWRPSISKALWFDALLKWETVGKKTLEQVAGCDLMLYWNEKQWQRGRGVGRAVVIWCSIEMRNSAASTINLRYRLWFDALLKWETVGRGILSAPSELWFDALLKWETVLLIRSISMSGCDLMLYWNEKQ